MYKNKKLKHATRRARTRTRRRRQLLCFLRVPFVLFDGKVLQYVEREVRALL
jgi:hypothetical protein